MSISLCMIAKDEEKNIGAALDSVKGICDEIIVVDTGSRDKTKEIALSSGAKVVDFKWNDDFSAARNESLKHATKEWILVLDCDEVMEKKHHQMLLDILKNDGQKKDVFGFTVLQINYTDDQKITGWKPSFDKEQGGERILRLGCRAPVQERQGDHILGKGPRARRAIH